MPYLICSKCAKEFYLPTQAYWNYSGDVTCANCGALQTVSLVNGELQGTPILKDFVLVNIFQAPIEINKDLYEAQICNAVLTNKACVVMCRRALEQVCNDKGAIGRSLYSKIKNLYDNGYISADDLNLFNEIRFFGNYGAHPSNDLLGDVTEEDSSLVLELTLHMIRHIYEIPDKLRRLRARRTK